MDLNDIFPFTTFPATCELCQQWLPNHAANCPRKGKPPSQWKYKDEQIMDDEDEPVTNDGKIMMDC
ncbi:hypothetical protein VKS41_006978 [Umbelopsis sp. WA50703]